LIPKLLFDITNCKSFKQEYDDSKPCFKISHYQLKSRVVPEEVMVPEPWDGDILQAPILIISSNPAFTEDEFFPTRNWPQEMIADYFTNRFKNRGPKYSWTYNHKILLKDGKRGHSVRYWSSIQKRVEEILGKIAVPGQDYCITEIVHCKTNKEFGVKEAIDFCAKEFLFRKIFISQAKLIIAIGAHVKSFFKEVSQLLSIPIIYLPHPASFEPKTIAAKYSEDQINEFREILGNQVLVNRNKNRNLFSSVKLPNDDEVIEFIQMKIRVNLSNKNT